MGYILYDTMVSNILLCRFKQWCTRGGMKYFHPFIFIYDDDITPCQDNYNTVNWLMLSHDWLSASLLHVCTVHTSGSGDKAIPLNHPVSRDAPVQSKVIQLLCMVLDNCVLSLTFIMKAKHSFIGIFPICWYHCILLSTVGVAGLHWCLLYGSKLVLWSMSLDWRPFFSTWVKPFYKYGRDTHVQIHMQII